MLQEMLTQAEAFAMGDATWIRVKDNEYDARWEPLAPGRVGEGWYGLSSEDSMTGAALLRSYCHMCSRDVKEK